MDEIKCRQKNLNVVICLGLAITLLSSWAKGEEMQAKDNAGTPAIFHINPNNQISKRPINRLIYGSFIELGLGKAADGLWAQMLFNRSFENVPPLTEAAINEQGQDFNSNTPWWTSWYEEKPWYTYDATGKTEIPAEREVPHWAFYHGKLAARVSYKGDGAWGIGQDGLWLRAGVDYQFRGFLTHDFEHSHNRQRQVTVKLVAENNPMHVIDSASLTFGTWFTECKVTLKNRDYTGYAALRVEADEPGNFFADGFELFPSDAVKGWRKDIIHSIKRVRPSILRFPGGCFASFHDWREGIGSRDDRSPVRSEFWGGLEYNDVGTDEFLDLCDLVDAEPFLVVNVLTGTPQMAADWVEYCNGSPESPMGKQRAANGHKEPRKVTYWELDNEAGRKFSPEQYAHKAVEFAAAMKAVDPSIKIAIVGYNGYSPKLAEILDICGQYIDFVSDRAYEEEDFSRNIATLSAYEKKTGRRIGLCNTEWVAPLYPPPGVADELNDRSRLQRWYYGMNVAVVLQRFRRNADWMDFANFNHLINTWGLNAIESSKSTAWLSCAGRVFEFYTDSKATWPIEVEPVQFEDNIHVSAALSASKNELCVNIINMGKKTSLDIALGAKSDAWEVQSTRGIIAPSLISFNTESDQNEVTIFKPKAEIRSGQLCVQLRDYSICEITLMRKR